MGYAEIREHLKLMKLASYRMGSGERASKGAAEGASDFGDTPRGMPSETWYLSKIWRAQVYVQKLTLGNIIKIVRSVPSIPRLRDNRDCNDYRKNMGNVHSSL